MKQLSGIDHMFLQMERGNQFMHVAGLGIYDPSTAPAGKVRFKDVLRFFAARIGEFPQFRRRLVTVPLALDRPYWVEDAAFDVEFHVRHIALPQPGDWRQLCIQVARLHSRPLDRSKPLWEVYVIEGLDNVDFAPPGSFAVYTKIHHSLIDGESGSEITRAVHSLEPDAVEDVEQPATMRIAERDPSALEMYSRALANNLGRLPDLARFSLRTASRVAALGAGYVVRTATNGGEIKSRLLSMITGDLSTVVPKFSPVTRFSANVSAHRVFEGVALSMADMKTIRQQVPDVTINDLFMTVVGGALNRYLAAKKELPKSSLIAAVPMSVRGADKMQVGNRVGFTVMPVCSDIADAVERLLAIRGAGATAKRVTGAIGRDLTMNMLDVLPPPLSETVIRNIKLPRLGVLVSNVRGPEVPLYMAGASLVGYLPLSIVIDGIGLNCTGFSCAGQLWICAVSCREMLPDPGFFADCLRGSFDDLKRGAAAYAEHHAPAALEPHEVMATARRKRKRPAAAVRRRKVNGAAARHLS
jgi:WS/DGAT/MGAT family acyltransferase